MFKNITEIVENDFSHITINKQFLNKLLKFINQWKYKSLHGDNSEFLGSNLLGVHSFTFSKYDDIRFYKDILYSSKGALEYSFHSLKGIDKSHKVASEPLFLSIVTLMHMTYLSKLSKKLEDDIIYNLFLIFSFKCFGSMYSYRFERPADEGIAKATYESLNKKFILKRTGNWQGVFDHRSKDVRRGGIFVERIIAMPNNTEFLTTTVTGIHTRYKKMLNFMYNEYIKTRDRKEKIDSESVMVKTKDDGEIKEEFKEVTSLQSKYVLYLRRVINNPFDLIREDYIHLISNMLPSCKKDKLEEVLLYISSNKEENNFLEDLIVSNMSYLASKYITHNYNSQMFKILKYLKGYWSSGTMKDPIAKKVKLDSSKIATKGIKNINKATIASVAIGLILYLTMLAITAFKEE